MAYTDLQLLRKMIADPQKAGFDEVIADGEAQDFKLSHAPVVSASYTVYLNNSALSETTQFTIDKDDGVITILTPPDAEDKVEVKYKYSVFSDEELAEYLTLDGSVNKAALRCVQILLTDSARRMDYEAGQTSVKAGQVFGHLKELAAYLKEEIKGSSSNVMVARRYSRQYGRNQSENRYIGEEVDPTIVDLSRDDL